MDRGERKDISSVRKKSVALQTTQDKSVSFQDKSEVNRQQVEAHTKWICVRFILVPERRVDILRAEAQSKSV